jgi:hypothetical protein
MRMSWSSSSVRVSKSRVGDGDWFTVCFLTLLSLFFWVVYMMTLASNIYSPHQMAPKIEIPTFTELCTEGQIS